VGRQCNALEGGGVDKVKTLQLEKVKVGVHDPPAPMVAAGMAPP